MLRDSAISDSDLTPWQQKQADRQAAQQAAQRPAAPPPSAAAPASTPPPADGTTGSNPPPSNPGGSSNTSFPVPPVPPPPEPGPTFSIAGSGSGGPTSFARPGTQAAAPFRSELFATNRGGIARDRGSAGGAAGHGPGASRISGPAMRLGAGSAVTSGFLPAGLDSSVGGGDGSNPNADALAKILAALQGAGGGSQQ